MDILTLTALLSPCLPFLLKLGDATLTSVGKKMGEDVWETAQKVWQKLHPKIAERPDVMVAVEAVAASPDDEDCQEFLQKKLAKLFKENPDLEQAIAEIMADSPAVTASVQINQTVGNNEGQVIGQMTGGNAIGRIDGNVQGDINL